MPQSTIIPLSSYQSGEDSTAQTININNRLHRCPVMEDLRNVYPDEWGRIRMVFPRQPVGPIDATSRPPIETNGPLLFHPQSLEDEIRQQFHNWPQDYLIEGISSHIPSNTIERYNNPRRASQLWKTARCHDYGELI